MFKKTDLKKKTIFHSAFHELSEMLKVKLEYEKKANSNNLDSGIPLEEYFVQEFGKFIPNYFSFGNGQILDRQYSTCGDCDFIIYDDKFSPFLKFPSTSNSRRKIVAYETVYGIIEIKQSLTLGAVKDDKIKETPSGSLYDACTKIFSFKELERKAILHRGFGVEMAPLHPHNIPFGMIFCYDTNIDVNDPKQLSTLYKEFQLVNELAHPAHRVDGVFVLNKFAILWSKKDEVDPELAVEVEYPDDADSEVCICSEEGTLYLMYVLLWKRLMKTTLGRPDLHIDYGGSDFLQFNAYEKPD